MIKRIGEERHNYVITNQLGVYVVDKWSVAINFLELPSNCVYIPQVCEVEIHGVNYEGVHFPSPFQDCLAVHAASF